MNKEIQIKLAEFLNLVAETERKVEVTRQVLVENRDFDPLRTFKRLLVSGDSFLQSKLPKGLSDREQSSRCLTQYSAQVEHLIRFFIDTRKKKTPSDDEIWQLFSYLDKKGKGNIDFKQFCSSVISKECKFFLTNTASKDEFEIAKEVEKTDGNLSRELEFSLARIFEQELLGIKILEEAKNVFLNLLKTSFQSQNSQRGHNQTLQNTSRELNVSRLGQLNMKMESMDPQDSAVLYHELFNLLDSEQKGYLEIRDIRKYVSDQVGAITYNRSERIVKKIDRNGDGKIDRFEFIYILTPYQSSIKISMSPSGQNSLILLNDYLEQRSTTKDRTKRSYEDKSGSNTFINFESDISTKRLLNPDLKQLERIKRPFDAKTSQDTSQFSKTITQKHLKSGSDVNNFSILRNNSREKSQRQQIKKMAESIRKSKRSISIPKSGSKTERSHSRSKSRSQKNDRRPMTYRERTGRQRRNYVGELIESTGERNKFSNTQKADPLTAQEEDKENIYELRQIQDRARTISKPQSRARNKQSNHLQRSDSSKENKRLKFTKDSVKDFKIKALRGSQYPKNERRVLKEISQDHGKKSKEQKTRFQQISFKKLESIDKNRDQFKNLTSGAEIREIEIWSSGKKARDEIFDVRQDSDLTKNSSKQSYRGKEYYQYERENFSVERSEKSRNKTSRLMSKDSEDSLMLRKYDRYEDYLPSDKRLNHITPNKANKYCKMNLARNDTEQYDLPIYQKHSARRKNSKVVRKRREYSDEHSRQKASSPSQREVVKFIDQSENEEEDLNISRQIFKPEEDSHSTRNIERRSREYSREIEHSRARRNQRNRARRGYSSSVKHIPNKKKDNLFKSDEFREDGPSRSESRSDGKFHSTLCRNCSNRKVKHRAKKNSKSRSHRQRRRSRSSSKFQMGNRNYSRELIEKRSSEKRRSSRSISRAQVEKDRIPNQPRSRNIRRKVSGSTAKKPLHNFHRNVPNVPNEINRDRGHMQTTQKSNPRIRHADQSLSKSQNRSKSTSKDYIPPHKNPSYGQNLANKRKKIAIYGEQAKVFYPEDSFSNQENKGPNNTCRQARSRSRTPGKEQPNPRNQRYCLKDVNKDHSGSKEFAPVRIRKHTNEEILSRSYNTPLKYDAAPYKSPPLLHQRQATSRIQDPYEAESSNSNVKKISSTEKQKAERLKIYNDRLRNGQPLIEIDPQNTEVYSKQSSNPKINLMGKNIFETHSDANYVPPGTMPPQNSRIVTQRCLQSMRNQNPNNTMNTVTSRRLQLTMAGPNNSKILSTRNYSKDGSQNNSQREGSRKFNSKGGSLRYNRSKRSIKDSFQDSVLRDYTESELNMETLNLEPQSVFNTLRNSASKILRKDNLLEEDRYVLKSNPTPNRIPRSPINRSRSKSRTKHGADSQKGRLSGQHKHLNSCRTSGFINVASFSPKSGIHHNLQKKQNPTTQMAKGSQVQSNSTIHIESQTRNVESSRPSEYETYIEIANEPHSKYDRFERHHNDNSSQNIKTQVKNFNNTQSCSQSEEVLNFKECFYALSTRKQDNLISAFQDLIQDEQIIEEKKIELALRSDFSLIDMFEILNHYKIKGSESKILISEIFKVCNLKNISREDIMVIMKKYDSNQDGYVNFLDFSSILLPKTHQFRQIMENKIPQDLTRFSQFKPETQAKFKSVIQTLLESEHQIKQISKEIFSILNKVHLNDGGPSSRRYDFESDVASEKMLSLQELGEVLSSGGKQRVSMVELSSILQGVKFNSQGLIEFKKFIEVFRK